MNVNIAVIFICTLFTVSLSGCAIPVMIESTGFELTKEIPDLKKVHSYPNLDLSSEDGPYLAVRFRTESNLTKKARNWTHHLYSQVVPCSQNELGYDLLSGDVFYLNKKRGSEAEYVSFISLKENEVLKHVSLYGDLETRKYLEIAKNSGLCFHVGGGTMLLSVLRSTHIKLPAQLDIDNNISLSKTLN